MNHLLFTINYAPVSPDTHQTLCHVQHSWLHCVINNSKHQPSQIVHDSQVQNESIVTELRTTCKCSQQSIWHFLPFLFTASRAQKELWTGEQSKFQGHKSLVDCLYWIAHVTNISKGQNIIFDHIKFPQNKLH